MRQHDLVRSDHHRRGHHRSEHYLPAECDCLSIEDVPQHDITLVTADDNCDDDVAIAWLGDSDLEGDCPKIITHTYRATDDCGNWAECTHVECTGFTPGYWKNNAAKKDAASCVPTGFDPSDILSDVLDFEGYQDNIFDVDTLLEALNYGGGSGLYGADKILLRAAVAALLNAGTCSISMNAASAEPCAAAPINPPRKRSPASWRPTSCCANAA